jgi:hypothetical protein
MRKKSINIVIVIMLVFLLSLVADSKVKESDLFYQGAVAPIREFHENITIPAYNFSVLQLQFNEGQELELIFSLFVKQQDKVIDVWFINSWEYDKFIAGENFRHFRDGSAEGISVASKVVSVTQYGLYLLVLANFNNTAVEVYLTYDINTYPQEEDTTPVTSDKGEEIPLWQEFYVLLPLGLVIGIIVGLLGSRLVGKSGKRAPKAVAKTPTKSVKKKKLKKKATPAVAPAKKKKVKKKEPVVEKKEEEPQEKEPEVTEKASSEEAAEKSPSPKFCGSCGSAVSTKFCQSCGEKVA